MRTWIAFLMCLSLPTLASENKSVNELEEAAAAVADSAEFFIPAKPIEHPPPIINRFFMMQELVSE